jgi:hypothetical protein
MNIPSPTFAGSFALAYLNKPGDIQKLPQDCSYSTPFIPYDEELGASISCPDNKDALVAAYLASQNIPFRYFPNKTQTSAN